MKSRRRPRPMQAICALNALALPDYDELTGAELIQYLNLNRTHANAGSKYIPAGKIHTHIHYFGADHEITVTEENHYILEWVLLDYMRIAYNKNCCVSKEMSKPFIYREYEEFLLIFTSYRKS